MKSKARKYKIEDIEVKELEYDEVYFTIPFTAKGSEYGLVVEYGDRGFFVSRIGEDIWAMEKMKGKFQNEYGYKYGEYMEEIEVDMKMEICLDDDFFRTYGGEVNIGKYFSDYMKGDKGKAVLKEYMVNALNEYEDIKRAWNEE